MSDKDSIGKMVKFHHGPAAVTGDKKRRHPNHGCKTTGFAGKGR
jgi:hypothetical protein